MASPLQILENATLTFDLPIAGTTVDSLGNVVANTEEVAIKCFLSEGSGGGSAGGLTLGASGAFGRELAGSAISTNPRTFAGYATNPSLIDLRVEPGTGGTAAIDGLPVSECRVAACRSPLGTGGLGAIVRPIIGDSISIVLSDRI